MNISPETSLNNKEYELQEDNTGLDEIHAALAEIEKLKNSTAEERKEPEEEEEKEDSESEDESEIEEEIPIPQKKEKKIWKETKRKYQLMAEKAQVVSALEKIQQENAQLREMLEQSLNSGTFHYGKSAYAELERAKENRRRAIEEGNIEAEIESAIALNKAVSTISELEKWSNTGNIKNHESPPPQLSPAPQNNNSTNNDYQYTELQKEMAEDWLSGHPYLQPLSPKYNPTFADQVASFVNRLDSSIARSGQRDVYFSEEYFDTIDNYITTLKKGAGKAAQTAESAAHVGGVRNSYSSSPTAKNTNSKQIVLSADEKRIAANLGISEEVYIKHKLEDLKENATRGR